MQKQVTFFHSESIQRTDNALLLLYLMNNKNRYYVRKQYQNYDTCRQTCVPVNNSVACRTFYPRVVVTLNKARQIVDVDVEYLIKKFVGLFLLFIRSLSQFSRAVSGF